MALPRKISTLLRLILHTFEISRKLKEKIEDYERHKLVLRRSCVSMVICASMGQIFSEKFVFDVDGAMASLFSFQKLPSVVLKLACDNMFVVLANL